MRIYKYLLILSIAILCLGCTNTSNETAELKTKNENLQREIDSLKKINPANNSAEVNKSDSFNVSKQPTEHVSDNRNSIRIGKHNFTLQWISWDEPGNVIIQPAEDGWYTIEGEQRSKKNADYLSIKGLIRKISASELEFKGEITSVVETNNDGKPCIKSGTKIFKTTKNRKYWRLQDMINCEGGMLTDYVDIYF